MKRMSNVVVKVEKVESEYIAGVLLRQLSSGNCLVAAGTERFEVKPEDVIECPVYWTVEQVLDTVRSFNPQVVASGMSDAEDLEGQLFQTANPDKCWLVVF